MKTRNICILGGTGFVGGHLINRLARDRHRIRVLTRRRERHRDIMVNPGVEVVECDIHEVHSLITHFAGCDAVINLVGILNESGRQTFQLVHEELPRKIIQACQANNITRLLHMSALNADAIHGSSHYLRSKGVGEDLTHHSGELVTTSFRPSVIFGPDDHFFNRFAALLRLSQVFFPLACPQARFAPVYVGDVAEAFAQALNNPATYGLRYELCGPSSYSLRELVEYTMELADIRRIIIGLGQSSSYLQARLLELLPGKPLSRDNLDSMQTDAVCAGEFPAIFGIAPTPVEAVVPGYIAIHRKDKQRQYQHYRRHAGRD